MPPWTKLLLLAVFLLIALPLVGYVGYQIGWALVITP